jgi:glucose/arabinose dehydrogenase
MRSHTITNGKHHHVLAALALTLGAVACQQSAKLPVESGMGPTPALPAPEKALIPMVNVAPARGWPEGKRPQGASGLTVNAYATNFEHPRWLHVLPNGDVLVAETNAPPKPEDNKGLRGWFIKRNMKKAGAAMPSADRITLLRDANGDGVAETRTVFLEGLHSPFGMALVKDDFYVANSDAIVRFKYVDGETTIKTEGTKLVDLPAGPINHHWTKSLIASPDGSKLYVTIGSNSNVGERGMDNERGRAAIWQVDRASGEYRVFASGLRNPNGMAFEPETGVLWTVVNERDELGSDLVPDYLTSVKDGGFYGWPYSYFGAHVDERIKPARPDLVSSAIVPDYALGSHTASLGLAVAAGDAFPPPFTKGMFIGQHGSWNRKPPSGYKVIFVPFQNGKPAGAPVDVATGFLSPKGEAYGRPVGVVVDSKGALLIADDVGNVVWRVAGAPRSASL